jgi:predicted metal-dependent phosphoesterase TrpH
MIRVDLHLHSHFSHDGKSSLEELIDRARQCGLDRLALTDHNTFDGAARFMELAPQLAIAGEEVKTLEGEVIGLFINDRISPFMAAEDAMDAIHAMGGLVYLPHPLDRRRANFRAERVVQLAPRVDIIETYNPWADQSANQAAARLAKDLDKATATGSDAHSAEELGRSWMEMDDYKDSEDFLEKLRVARHVVTASSGTGRRA